MNTLSGVDRQRSLVAALANAAGTGRAEVIETHISWVLLLGEYAYKFKKALNLGFLDYSSLEQRHHFCIEELRLNRRTAPALYLDVIPITGDSRHPVLGGEGDAIEWAVKMQRFAQTGLASHLIEHNLLTPRHIDRLAQTIAEFHQRIVMADPQSDFGTVANVCQPIEENFQQIRSLSEASGMSDLLTPLHRWYSSAITALTPLLEMRKLQGFIRECHGDLHLGNIVVMEDDPLPFDGIEFNDNLRFIDIISEVAFLLMDLDHRRHSEFGWRFLDSYLQQSGDFPGLALLRFYQVYRAMVRAKVMAIRLGQKDLDNAERPMLMAELVGYLQLASCYTVTASPQLVITHGFSGSGKSSVAQQLLERWGAVRIRSDVERKRLFGLEATARTNAQVATGIYTADASAKTYARLVQLAEVLLAAGFNVIVDATFLRRADRAQFIQLAQSRHVRWHLLDVTASEAVMRERIVKRHAGRSDASEADLAVLESQLHHHDPFTADERAHCISINTDEAWSVEPLIAALD